MHARILKPILIINLIVCLALITNAQKKSKDKSSRILVFSKTKGFYHKSIPIGIAAIQKLGVENKFTVDTTKNTAYFTDDSLKHYKAVVFLSTTGDVLDDEQQEAFKRYILGGGGYVGIHAAADTEYTWPWYNQLVGAYFLSHPKTQQATILVTDKKHPSTKGLPDKWTRTDEWYNYKDIAPGLTVIAKLDETSYEGGKNGNDHPFVWYHSLEKGRAFYTGAGHTDESYADPLFQQHLLGGIKYAMGK